MKSNSEIDATVCETIFQVIRDTGRTTKPIAREDRLREGLALDSMDLAVIVVRLDRRLGVDPFRQRRQPVQTVADLIAAYHEALASTQ